MILTNSTSHSTYRKLVILISILIAIIVTCCQKSDSESDQAEAGLSRSEHQVINIFRQSSPSVVHITSMSLLRSRFNLATYEREEGSGTGFIWDRKGHIVTNYHVIKQGNLAQVALSLPSEKSADGDPQQIFEATLIGAAPNKDLAVLKINTPTQLLKPLPLGQSSTLQVGQSVLAIGNPFGFDQTLTTGVISGLGREIKSVTRRVIKGVIQTDAAINPGNSGGPLLNSLGQLIGVNTAIYSPSGAYAGIGFAVPVDTVKRVVPQLIKYGGEVRPSLGIDLDEGRLSHRYRLPGTLIIRVDPNSDAKKAGLNGVRWSRQGLILGDIILAINNIKTPNAEAIYQALDQQTVGQEITLTIQRGLGRQSQRKTLKLILKGEVD
jgi:S1-C subfamily serine protease